MSADKEKDPRKAQVTEEHRAEARALKAIWDRVKPSSQGEFGKEFGIGGQSAVANFLTGQSALSLKAAVGFANGLGCKIRDFSKRLAVEAHRTADAAGLVSDEDSYLIPRLDVLVGAGDGRITSSEDEIGGLSFRRDFLRECGIYTPHEGVIVNVRGESMGDTIADGAVILINKKVKSPEHRKIFVFVKDEGPVVKRVIHEGDRWIARSDNENKRRYPDFPFEAGQTLVGKAVWMGTKL
ncbi:S24 family peptidase [Variovorax sp. CAN2819]|uniref:S24 family peptidase n=1 Tax=Variovorax sp. CAN15 TaxID=3046727 RepID=UPI00264951C7|nr:S24 family peptidase [Variovorax sp. CAN15]MDN6885318.1 S24 family peptidase [Variovorax sp. CAN15]